jgi:hypothetical protein
MTSILFILLRLFLIALALPVAATVAVIAFVYLFNLTAATETEGVISLFTPQSPVFSGSDPMAWFLYHFFAVLDYFLNYTSGVLLLPGLLVIVVAEVLRIRSLLYYMVAGAASFVAMPFVPVVASQLPVALTNYVFLTVMAAVGVAASIVYWAIAGRYA